MSSFFTFLQTIRLGHRCKRYKILKKIINIFFISSYFQLSKAVINSLLRMSTLAVSQSTDRKLKKQQRAQYKLSYPKNVFLLFDLRLIDSKKSKQSRYCICLPSLSLSLSEVNSTYVEVRPKTISVFPILINNKIIRGSIFVPSWLKSY